ncbi:Excalibur calcium-binding domain [Sebaldella termitidis]|uniref:Excalibur domain protein n=1 Tax=Sebaldella termitidis (strain ATCC 33386 / NCTC 11300) TaxID=526218 RepID=D1AR64_SEBTE|nr:excalibur calcium-binding domain-containing protein [Sebaldella termitidis]ACZ07752.1 Excalibur domain protein [Sebaldella termitidis ATCC 33386]SUI23049.1 Excalibur calcium-binding domain [Sebaldella termitidis]
MRKMKRIILLIAVIGLILITAGYGYYIKEKETFYNCTQAKLKGYYNIPKESKLYRKSLDRDNNGVACEVSEDQL